MRSPRSFSQYPGLLRGPLRRRFLVIFCQLNRNFQLRQAASPYFDLLFHTHSTCEPC